MNNSPLFCLATNFSAGVQGRLKGNRPLFHPSVESNLEERGKQGRERRKGKGRVVSLGCQHRWEKTGQPQKGGSARLAGNRALDADIKPKRLRKVVRPGVLCCLLCVIAFVVVVLVFSLLVFVNVRLFSLARVPKQRGKSELQVERQRMSEVSYLLQDKILLSVSRALKSEPPNQRNFF